MIPVMNMSEKNGAYLSPQVQIGESQSLTVHRKHFRGFTQLHWHGFFEIEVILGGHGTQTLNGQPYPLKRGCIYFLTPLDFHEVTAEEDVELYNLMFREDMLSQTLLSTVYEAGQGRILYLTEPDFDEVFSLCSLLEQEYSRQAPHREEYLRNLLECFLILIFRQLRQTLPDSGQTRKDYIQKAMLYLQWNFRKNPSLADVAAAVNLNANYFSQRFREETGQSYTEYLTGLKLAYAKRLLRSGELSVTEVCFDSGFTSLSNFLKVFRQETGLSPSQYRKRSP